jgi:hypothetical protein
MASLRKPNSGSFRVGNAGGPGRPKGSRTRLQEFVIEMLDADFREHGAQVIETVRQKHPQIYLSAIVSLLPRQTQTEKISPLGELTDEEIEQLERYLRASRAQLVPELEQHNGAAVALEPSDTKQQQKP